MYTKPAPPKKPALVTEKLCSWRSLMSFRDQDQKTQTPCKLQILNSVTLFESPVSRVQGSYGACVCWKLLWFHIQHQQQHPPSRSLKASRPCAATPSNPPHLVSRLIRTWLGQVPAAGCIQGQLTPTAPSSGTTLS